MNIYFKPEKHKKALTKIVSAEMFSKLKPNILL